MKKRFTLIELLAVIVILAIIALIAVPSILVVIEKVSNRIYRCYRKLFKYKKENIKDAIYTDLEEFNEKYKFYDKTNLVKYSSFDYENVIARLI